MTIDLIQKNLITPKPLAHTEAASFFAPLARKRYSGWLEIAPEKEIPKFYKFQIPKILQLHSA